VLRLQKKALPERVFNAEMDHHLAGEAVGDRRNGYGRKTVITDAGAIALKFARPPGPFRSAPIANGRRRSPSV